MPQLGTHQRNLPGAPPTSSAEIARLAARQHGLITVPQLLAAGLSKSTISRRRHAGTLHRVHRGVYALVASAAMSQEAWWLAAVLGAGPGSALSHDSGAELMQAKRGRSSPIHVTSPHRRRSLRNVIVHECRNLDPRDITKRNGIPVTTMARILVDLTDEYIAEEIANVIHEAAYRNRYDESATRRAAKRANGRRNLQVLEDAIALHNHGSAGLKSKEEAAFFKSLTRADIPKPLVNVHLYDIEVDLHWPDRRLVIEVDGSGHGRRQTRREDVLKTAVLEAHGWRVERVKVGEHALERVREILASEGTGL